MRRGDTSAGRPLNVPPLELCLGGCPAASRHTPHLCFSKLCPFCRACLDAPLFCVPQIFWAHPRRGPSHASRQKLHLQEWPHSAQRQAGSPAPCTPAVRTRDAGSPAPCTLAVRTREAGSPALCTPAVRIRGH